MFTKNKNINFIIVNTLHLFALSFFIYYFVNSEDDWRYLHTRVGDYQNSNRMPLFDCFYFCAVTISTVGYGDIVPQSNSAKLVSIYIIMTLIYHLTSLIV